MLIKQKQKISRINVVDFQNFQTSNFDGGKFLKILSFINLPWGHARFHKKFGPDRLSRFDVYLIQTDKPNLYIDLIYYISIYMYKRLDQIV